MEKTAGNENIRRSALRALLGSGLSSNLLIYIALIIVATSIPVTYKVLSVIGCALVTIISSIVNLKIIRSSDDIIDQLNSEAFTEILNYCVEKYKTNDEQEPLNFFFTSNEDETMIYLNCCLTDNEGKDLEETKATIMELWRFQKTEEFLSKPVSFLKDEKNRLVDIAKSGVDEFFIRFRDFLSKQK